MMASFFYIFAQLLEVNPASIYKVGQGKIEVHRKAEGIFQTPNFKEGKTPYQDRDRVNYQSLDIRVKERTANC